MTPVLLNAILNLQTRIIKIEFKWRRLSTVAG